MTDLLEPQDKQIIFPIGHSRRTPRCWACHTGLDNATDEECNFCGWIICPRCGACDPNCTFSHKTGRDAELRRVVRDYLLENPNVNEDGLEEYINEQRTILTEKRERIRLEEQRRQQELEKLKEQELERLKQQEKERIAALAKELEKKIKGNQNVEHIIYGSGVITRLFYDDGKLKLYVRFKDKDRRFNFPETFDNGSMRFR